MALSPNHTENQESLACFHQVTKLLLCHPAIRTECEQQFPNIRGKVVANQGSLGIKHAMVVFNERLGGIIHPINILTTTVSHHIGVGVTLQCRVHAPMGTKKSAPRPPCVVSRLWEAQKDQTPLGQGKLAPKNPLPRIMRRGKSDHQIIAILTLQERDQGACQSGPGIRDLQCHVAGKK